MGKYSKAIGAIVGSLVGAAGIYAAGKGFGSCDPTGTSCTIGGIDQGTLTEVVLGILATLGVYVAPKNTN